MEKMVVVLVKGKETKGTYVYEEELGEGGKPPVLKSQYIQLGRSRHNEEELVLDMRADGMPFADVTYGWEYGDTLVYLDPAKAPAQHPEAPTIDSEREKKGVDPMQGKLFGTPS